MWFSLYAVLGCSLQLACVLVWMSEPPALASLALHLAGSGLAARLLVQVLPGEDPNQRRRVWPLFAGLLLFVPVLGAAGVCVGVLWPLRTTKRPAQAGNWLSFAFPDWPASYQPKNTALAAGDSLAACLRGARDPSRRLAALSSTRRWSHREAVPALTLALRDSVDEVRLFAYALLQAREKTLYDRIKAAQARPDLQASAATHRVLAQLHWELVDSGFAQGAIRERMLTAARQHAEAGLALDPKNGPLRCLAARILLALGETDAAAVSLALAVEQGLPPRVVAPYLGEVAFRRRTARTKERVHLVASILAGERVVATSVRRET